MNVYDQIQKNKLRTAVLLSLFLVVVLALGYALSIVLEAPPVGILFFAGVLSIVMSLLSYYTGDKLALVASGAKRIEEKDNPYVYKIVENVSITAGIPMPKVYLIQDEAMNAFSTGRDPEHASIALTTGLVSGLENEELEAVAAHEISHIRNYDTRVMMLIAVLVGCVTLVGDMAIRGRLLHGRRNNNSNGGGQIQLALIVIALVFIVLSPIIAELIKLAVSRKREYLADASAVLLTRYADALANALEKIEQQGAKLTRINGATAHLYFSNPFGAKKKFGGIFSTHPPIRERIRLLREMGGTTQNDV